VLLFVIPPSIRRQHHNQTTLISTFRKYSNFSNVWQRIRRSVFQERQCLNPVLASLWSGKPVMDYIGASQMEQMLTARFAVHEVHAADTYHCCKHISYQECDTSLRGPDVFPATRCTSACDSCSSSVSTMNRFSPPNDNNLDQGQRGSTFRSLHS
jgi:hypothetical protein